MTDHDDIDMLAAEYVLGTLDAEERAEVAQRRQHDADMEARILAWEARLAPLGNEVEAIAPGPDLLERIERRIDELEATFQTKSKSEDDTHGATQVIALRRRLGFWRGCTGLATAAALILAVVMIAPFDDTPDAPPFVAVFQQDDQQPAFMLSVDLDSRRLNVRPVTAKPLPDRSYQLWIKADALGPKPRSVGVLNDDLSLPADALSDYDSELLKRATFGISIEPPGGSPTGQPTGSAIHGYLYPTDRDAVSQHL
ncbi:anti-sigma factor domain-containing protein [Chromohalobacter beijerinckii]|uniref:Anti-sigma factor domain-containing protein n=1 Tax=Chromohalobacter beijerinckii TaxID=86179 RepID=A0ABV8XFK6_9GAMM|nr:MULTISPECIES: anti-sigma factor [Chromohalobacter]MCK0765687.1 anti-sigma factor [Chromohalobacter beijerinckii]